MSLRNLGARRIDNGVGAGIGVGSGADGGAVVGAVARKVFSFDILGGICVGTTVGIFFGPCAGLGVAVRINGARGRRHALCRDLN